MRTISPPFPAHDVVFAPDGAAVWVTSGSERRVALYGRGERLHRMLAAGSPPQHVTFARGKAFVAAATTARFAATGSTASSCARRASRPARTTSTFGWGRVVTPSLGGGTLAVLDRNGRVRAIRRVARAAHDACIVFGT